MAVHVARRIGVAYIEPIYEVTWPFKRPKGLILTLWWYIGLQDCEDHAELHLGYMIL